jgi:hypothetical protein
MNDELRQAIRYRVTNYPRAHEQPVDAREVRCFWCDHRKERPDAVCCDPVKMANL